MMTALMVKLTAVDDDDDYHYESSAPVRVATTKEQRDSLAELPKAKRYALYESITEEDLSSYHNISCQPITINAENDMVTMS